MAQDKTHGNRARRRRFYIPLLKAIFNLSNCAISDDLEWPWRSFAYCKLYQIRFFSCNCATIDKISTDTKRRASLCDSSTCIP